MSEDSNKDNENTDNGQGEGDKKQDVDIKSIMSDNESLKKQVNALTGKLDEVLGEKKRLSKKFKETEEQAAERQRKEAEQRGEFEQLYKSASEKNKELADQLQQIENDRASEKVRTASYKIASELADGPNAELLSEFVAKRVKYVDGELKVLDGKGNLTVSSLEDLKKEFASGDKFKSLLRGSKASGGGAAGSGGGAPSNKKSMSRSELKKLDAKERMEFFKSGGTAYDD